MKRAEKAILPLVRSLAYRLNQQQLYYWSDNRLRVLSDVLVMPRFYYRWLHAVCLRMAETRTLERLADKVIHTIPLKVRFEVA